MICILARKTRLIIRYMESVNLRAQHSERVFHKTCYYGFSSKRVKHMNFLRKHIAEVSLITDRHSYKDAQVQPCKCYHLVHSVLLAASVSIRVYPNNLDVIDISIFFSPFIPFIVSSYIFKVLFPSVNYITTT